MNETITRIVNLLFEDVVENEETAAMREEILYNCQERFNDLVAGGVDADTATAAIVESLKGMEDVLSQYAKKPTDEQAFEEAGFADAQGAAGAEAFQNEEADTREEDHGEEASNIFPATQVKTLSIGLVDDTVKLAPSDDGQVHVLCEDEPDGLWVKLEDGTLRIERKLTDGEQPQNGFHLDVSANNLGEFFEKLFSNFSLKKIVNSVNQLTKSMTVTVLLPRESGIRVQISTTSGNLSLDALKIGNCQLTTTSGDVNINCCTMNELRMTSTSGDLDTSDTHVMGSLQLVSTSGDIDCQGSCGHASVNTVSGDMKLEGKMDDLHLRTVSGDAEVNALEGIQSIVGKSTSGDFSIILPENVRVEPHFKSLSGDMRMHHHEGLGSATVHIDVTSVSGNISIY